MLKVFINTSKFDRTFSEYIKVNKRSLSEITNKMGFEIAKICTKTTKFTPKDQIRATLDSASRISPTLRVCELLANLVRKGKGLPALSRNKLRIAGNKYRTQHAKGSKMILAGWIPAIKILASFNKGSTGTTSAARGFPKGGGKAAQPNSWTPVTSIWNAVEGGFKRWQNAPPRNLAKVRKIKADGLQAALNTKEADMRVYLERKANEAAKRFNQS